MVARFAFKLEPLLEHRRRIERDHRVAVASIEAERAAIESEMRDLGARADRSRAGLRDALAPGGGAVDAHAARWQAASAMSLDARARQLAVKLAGVLKRLEAARVLLVDASKDRRAVERLRERRYEAFCAEVARGEAATLDDMNSARSARASDGG